jgi:Rhodopirellula transposase DDE domain
MGAKGFPNARDLLIVVDGGGSNSSRYWLRKVALQKLADRTGLELGVSICHRGPASGTRSNIVSFATSLRTGAGNP